MKLVMEFVVLLCTWATVSFVFFGTDDAHYEVTKLWREIMSIRIGDSSEMSMTKQEKKWVRYVPVKPKKNGVYKVEERECTFQEAMEQAYRCQLMINEVRK
jgi:hypothetical protein